MFSARVPPGIMLGGWRWPLQWKYFHCHCNDFRFYVTLCRCGKGKKKCVVCVKNNCVTLWIAFLRFVPLSKVLFKLSLTLLVRYRSSYSVFNFSGQIPADWHCIPKQCYSIDCPRMRCSGLWLNGLTPSLAQYSHEGLDSAMGLLCTWIWPFPHQSRRTVYATTQERWAPIRQRVRFLFGRPWLRKSRLFSFPPLNNMLKFGG